MLNFESCRSLNSNSFIGEVPASIGNLKHLYWLDLSDNQLTGSIPVSDGSKPGLDLLVNTKHLYVLFLYFDAVVISIMASSIHLINF